MFRSLLLRQFFVSASSSLGSKAVGITIAIVTARLLGPAGYGLLGLVFSIVIFYGNFLDVGPMNFTNFLSPSFKLG